MSRSKTRQLVRTRTHTFLPLMGVTGLRESKDNLTDFQRPLTVQSVYSDEGGGRHHFKVTAFLLCFHHTDEEHTHLVAENKTLDTAGI